MTTPLQNKEERIIWQIDPSKTTTAGSRLLWWGIEKAKLSDKGCRERR